MSLRFSLFVLLYLFIRILHTSADLVDDVDYTNGDYSEDQGISQISFNASEDDTSEFPPDLFSLTIRRRGVIILHFIGALFSFVVIGIVCGDYFLPSVDCICSDLKLSQDVAAATFMSFATTAPELFIILIATFLTESDVGVGTIVGCGMFNVLGVATVGGLAAVGSIKLDWWPLFRDSCVYMFAVAHLAFILNDGVVTLSESIGLVLNYFLYFVIMFFNRKIRKKVKFLIKKIKNKKENKIVAEKSFPTLPTISLTVADDKNNNQMPAVDSVDSKDNQQEEPENDDEVFKAFFVHYEDRISLRRISASSRGSNISDQSRRKSLRSLSMRGSIHLLNPNQLHVNDLLGVLPKLSDVAILEKPEYEDDDEEQEDFSFKSNFCTFPVGSIFNKFIWLSLWPISFLLYCSIPDCRREKWRNYYPITFFMCIIWIGMCSYFGTWMITIMGETLNIPNSVMGLTFLAFGGSMPEAISSYIMARQGEGGLGFSNSLGGNTMDICLCLGLPWLIRSSVKGQIVIQSKGIRYNAVSLIFGVLVLLSVSISTKFNMNKRMGFFCSMSYLVFLIVSILIELQVIKINV